MDIDGIGAWRKLDVFAAICLMVSLGELRGAGADAVASTAIPAHAMGATIDALCSDRTAQRGADEDAPSTSAQLGDSTDDARLVPAIYARDPDVRFVYSRRVSKWM